MPYGSPLVLKPVISPRLGEGGVTVEFQGVFHNRGFTLVPTSPAETLPKQVRRKGQHCGDATLCCSHEDLSSESDSHLLPLQFPLIGPFPDILVCPFLDILSPPHGTG